MGAGPGKQEAGAQLWPFILLNLPLPDSNFGVNNPTGPMSLDLYQDQIRQWEIKCL